MVLVKVEHILDLYGIIKDLMKQKVLNTNWENLISDASDVHVAATNFTNTFINLASACIPTRDATIRCDDKVLLIQI